MDKNISVSRQFGATIRHFREHAHLSKDELRRKAGVSNDTMYRAEAGENVGVAHLERIAAALGVPLARLFLPLDDTRPWWESPETGRLLDLWHKLEPPDRDLVFDMMQRVTALYRRSVVIVDRRKANLGPPPPGVERRASSGDRPSEGPS